MKASRMAQALVMIIALCAVVACRVDAARFNSAVDYRAARGDSYGALTPFLEVATDVMDTFDFEFPLRGAEDECNGGPHHDKNGTCFECMKGTLEVMEDHVINATSMVCEKEADKITNPKFEYFCKLVKSDPNKAFRLVVKLMHGIPVKIAYGYCYKKGACKCCPKPSLDIEDYVVDEEEEDKERAEGTFLAALSKEFPVRIDDVTGFGSCKACVNQTIAIVEGKIIKLAEEVCLAPIPNAEFQHYCDMVKTDPMKIIKYICHMEGIKPVEIAHRICKQQGECGKPSEASESLLDSFLKHLPSSAEKLDDQGN